MTPKMLLLIAGLTLGRHPLHTTHTDLVEADGGRVTITVRSFTDDLRSAVGRRARTLDDSAFARYARDRVQLLDRGGRLMPLVFDGTRIEGDITLLLLHAELDGGLRGAAFLQTMQMELYDDQVNVVQSRYARRSVSLLFLPGDGARTLP